MDQKTKDLTNAENTEQSSSTLDATVFDHTGHRGRLKSFYKQNGMDVMKDYEILELILFYAIPRKDTRVIARRLLNHFGSLAAVLDADRNELVKIKGLSENTVTLLKLFPDIARAYALSKQEEKPYLETEQEIEAYLSNFFIGRSVECFYVLSLDSASRLIRCVKIAEGEPDAVIVNLKKVGLEIAASGASSVVLAHNHPNGLALPSKKDVEVTEKIAALAEDLGSRLIDHIIFSPTEHFSMAHSNKFYRQFFHD